MLIQDWQNRSTSNPIPANNQQPTTKSDGQTINFDFDLNSNPSSVDNIHWGNNSPFVDQQFGWMPPVNITWYSDTNQQSDPSLVAGQSGFNADRPMNVAVVDSVNKQDKWINFDFELNNSNITKNDSNEIQELNKNSLVSDSASPIFEQNDIWSQGDKVETHTNIDFDIQPLANSVGTNPIQKNTDDIMIDVAPVASDISVSWSDNNVPIIGNDLSATWDDSVTTVTELNVSDNANNITDAVGQDSTIDNIDSSEEVSVNSVIELPNTVKTEVEENEQVQVSDNGNEAYVPKNDGLTDLYNKMCNTMKEISTFTWSSNLYIQNQSDNSSYSFASNENNLEVVKTQAGSAQNALFFEDNGGNIVVSLNEKKILDPNRLDQDVENVLVDKCHKFLEILLEQLSKVKKNKESDDKKQTLAELWFF